MGKTCVVKSCPTRRKVENKKIIHLSPCLFSDQQDCCFISGFTEEVDRVFLRKELSKFGEIRKIFIPPTEEYAKVYFTDNSSVIKALQGLTQNLFGWKVTIQQDTRSTNCESSSTSKMFCNDEFDVQNSSERLYTVHGQFIECLGDGMGNVFVNLEDVRRSGFAVYSEEDLNFSIEEKRGIILDDFYQYMLSQAMLYLNKKKELHKYIKEEQILNTIERCRMKLLGDGREDNFNDRSVNQINNNLKVSVPNRHRDKSIGRRQERNSNFGKNNSFAEDSPVVRPPKNLPNNFTPTHTQKYTGAGMQNRNRDPTSNRNRNDTSSNNKPRFNQNRNSRSNTRNNDEEYRDRGRSESKQNYRPSTSNNAEECWGSEQPEPKQQSQQTFKNSQFEKTRQPNVTNNSNFNRKTESNQCDTLSQLSDSSEKKIKLIKFLEAVDNIGKDDLEINQTYDVQIMEMEKNNICWVQKTESSQDLEDLHLAIMEENSELKAISDLQRGQLGLANFEDIWCRCRVMSLNPLNVLFVDYGNKAIVEEIKELPDKFRKVPALAIRLVVDMGSQKISTGMNMKIKVKTKYDDDTYLVYAQKIFDSQIAKKEEENPVTIESPSAKIENTISQSDSESSKPVEELKTETKEMCYLDIPKPLEELKNNDKVMLLDLINNQMIVKTRECVRKSKELLDYIKTLDKSNLILKQVKEGQMVLGTKDGLPNLCRAVVTSQKSPMVTIRYLDYVGEEILLINSLRNVDEYLATQPTTLILTPEMEVINTITKKSIDFIASLIENKEKAVVILTEDNDFDLKLESGTLFTQKLLELEQSNIENYPKLVLADDLTTTPKIKEHEKPKTTEIAKSSPEPTVLVQEPAASSLEPESDVAIITFNDMDYFKPKIGATATYLCYTLKDLSEITLISMEEDSVEKLNCVSDLAISDDKPYKPEVHEMCVFLYKTPDETEPVWYRGVVMDKEKDEYTISMVDFGTLVTVTSKDIRKFPPHLKEIPMLGIFCELINIPHTEELLNAVKKLLPEGEEVEVTVKWENDLTYGIELPNIYDELKKLKLL